MGAHKWSLQSCLHRPVPELGVLPHTWLSRILTDGRIPIHSHIYLQISIHLSLESEIQSQPTVIKQWKRHFS
jgi:hypothetical protein